MKDRWRPRRTSLFYRRAQFTPLYKREETRNFGEETSPFRQSVMQLTWMSYFAWPSLQQVVPLLSPLVLKLSLWVLALMMWDTARVWIRWALLPVYILNWRPQRLQKNMTCQCPTALKSKPESTPVQLIPIQGRGLHFQFTSYIYLHNSECKFCISSHMGITNWKVRFLINLCPQENTIMRTPLWWQYSHINLLSSR